MSTHTGVSAHRRRLLIAAGAAMLIGAHGTTQLYGTFDRRTFDIVIKTKGRLSY